jgi:hypothetical protein
MGSCGLKSHPFSWGHPSHTDQAVKVEFGDDPWSQFKARWKYVIIFLG